MERKGGCKMYEFEIGQSVCLRPNFAELWDLNNRKHPLPHIVEHFEDLVGKELLILDRLYAFGCQIYNIEGFGFEEYILAPYEKDLCRGQ